MNKLQRYQYEMVSAVHVFCKERRSIFPEDSPARRVSDRIVAIYDKISKLRVKQVHGIDNAKGNTSDKREALKLLRERLNLMIQAARFIARTIPEFDEPFKLPKGRGHEALLYTAHNFAERAAAFPDEFAKYALSIDELDGMIRAVVEAIQRHAASRSVHRNATSGLDASIKEALDAIHELDLILATQLRNDVPVMEVWKSVRRVKCLPRRKKPAGSASEATGTYDAAPVG